MTEELMNWHLQAIARGMAKGKAEAIEKAARNMLAMGKDDAFVSQATGLNIGTVKKLRAAMCA